MTTSSFQPLQPTVAADCCFFSFDGSQLRVLIIRRAKEPYQECEALPGSFLRTGETVERAVDRLCRLFLPLEQTASLLSYPSPLPSSSSALPALAPAVARPCAELAAQSAILSGVYSKVNRDPRGRVLSVAHALTVSGPLDEAMQQHVALVGGAWIPVSEALRLDLAFDHNSILRDALAALRRELPSAPIAFRMLPPKFTLGELHALYESLLGLQLDRSNFAKKILKLGLLTPLDEEVWPTPKRAARLYAFNEAGYASFKSSSGSMLEY